MNKHLLIIRHAKSSWSDSGLADYDRPLNRRGKRDAPRMGRWLVHQGLVPELIVSSSAQRARETTQLLSVACGCERIEYDDDLYHASSRTCISRLAQVDDRFSRVALVAHNPGLEQLVEDLSGEIEFMPTTAIAHLTHRSPWAELSDPESPDLRDLWRPKELPADFE